MKWTNFLLKERITSLAHRFLFWLGWHEKQNFQASKKCHRHDMRKRCTSSSLEVLFSRNCSLEVSLPPKVLTRGLLVKNRFLEVSFVLKSLTRCLFEQIILIRGVFERNFSLEVPSLYFYTDFQSFNQIKYLEMWKETCFISLVGAIQPKCRPWNSLFPKISHLGLSYTLWPTSWSTRLHSFVQSVLQESVFHRFSVAAYLKWCTSNTSTSIPECIMLV